MHSRIIALAAALATASAVAWAQTNAPSTVTAPSHTATPNGAAAPSVTATQPQAQNPMINPNAAGTQTGWRGYGATSSAARPVSPSGGELRPGGSLASQPGSPLPPNQALQNDQQARNRLSQLGYSHVTAVKRLGNGGWEATANKDNRQVDVRIDDQGVVTSER
jgi:hypothetical protein